MPEILVGAWESAQPGSNTTLAYRFTGDGRYAYAGVLTYPRSEQKDDFYLLKTTAVGTADVDARQLTLRPSSASTTRKDPRFPGDDYTDRPEPLTPKHFTWAVADQVLTLTGEDNLQFVFLRAAS
jgi:hypothetical protein